jgi:hypothetical protein
MIFTLGGLSIAPMAQKYDIYDGEQTIPSRGGED